jgi:hypothetical protein
MGFKEIYLLGADCYYTSDMNHHFKNYELYDPSYASVQDMMTVSYKVAKKYADKHNIKIFNAPGEGNWAYLKESILMKYLKEINGKFHPYNS